jgi:hypothetical protein
MPDQQTSSLSLLLVVDMPCHQRRILSYTVKVKVLAVTFMCMWVCARTGRILASFLLCAIAPRSQENQLSLKLASRAIINIDSATPLAGNKPGIRLNGRVARPISRCAHMWERPAPKKGFKSGISCSRTSGGSVFAAAPNTCPDSYIAGANIFSPRMLSRRLETSRPSDGTYKRPGAQALHILYRRLTSRPTRRLINFTHVNYSFLCVTSRARKSSPKKRDACVISKLGPDADFDHYSHNSVKHENRTFASQPGIKNASTRDTFSLTKLR